MAERKRSDFKKVILQRKSEECNDRGQPENKWVTIRRIYACAVPRSSRERTVRNARADTTRWEIEMVYLGGMTSDDRILWQGRWLEFSGKPYSDGKRCRTLKVSAVEVDCQPGEIEEVCKCQIKK